MSLFLGRPFIFFLYKGAFETNVREGGKECMGRLSSVAFFWGGVPFLAIMNLACYFGRKMEDQTVLEKGVPFYSHHVQRRGDSSAQLDWSLQGDL